MDNYPNLFYACVTARTAQLH